METLVIDTIDEPSTPFKRRWVNLLSWLKDHGFQTPDLLLECREIEHAGHGLFALRACSPGSVLFAIPPKALMNKMTLKRQYPAHTRVVKALTAVQLISMHLFLWRPKVDEESADPLFGPYISILPRDFSSHPLTWLVQSKLDKIDVKQVPLLASLPPSVLAALNHLHTRFLDDWSKVCAFLRRTPSIANAVQRPPDDLKAPDTVMDFLWAWLNVNTRCIYYRLKHLQSDPDNLTMCPVLDFANHTQVQAHMEPLTSKADIWNSAPVNSIGDGLKFISLGDAKIEEGEEIRLTYGAHSNKTLFVEYGFVNPLSEHRPLPSGEVDVQDLVDEHVFVDAELHDKVRAVLVAEGYWGHWALHSIPGSGQPSWRLITALRLYHLAVNVGSTDDHHIQGWRDVVAGKQTRISSDNEQAWRRTVVFICDTLIQRAEKSIGVGYLKNDSGEDGWVQWARQNIRTLWEEELWVARVVKQSILRGDEF